MTSDPRAAEEVFFDGGCPVCRREISAYQGLESLKGTRFIDVSTPDAVPADIAPEVALARFHIRRVDGKVESGFKAFIAVWRGIPRLRPIAVALDRQPFLWIGEGAYRGFLVLRKLWRR